MESRDDNQLPEGLDPERFCYYPFTQLLLQPTGAVSPCCWSQHLTAGEVPWDRIPEIWNGELMRKIRGEFLEGRIETCRRQMAEIGCHRWSRRAEGWEGGPIEFAERQSRGPRRLDLRLNGKCNLQCVMCDVWRQPNGTYDGTEFWEKGPKEIFPFLVEIDVLGGEPFVQPDTYRLIDEVSACNPECSWGFVTNGQYQFNRAIRDRLDRINVRWIQLSLDSVHPETYSKVRLRGELSRALATLKALREYRVERILKGKSKFKLSISMCVQKANWRETGDFLEFAEKNGLELDLQFAYNPDPVSLHTLPAGERAEACAYFESLCGRFEPGHLQPVIRALKDSPGGQ